VQQQQQRKSPGTIPFGDLREQVTSDRREEQGKQAATARLRQQPTSWL